MSTREHYVAGQAPDWRAPEPRHRPVARRLPKSVRKALREYRRRAYPMAGCDSLTWPILAALTVATLVIAIMAVFGWLP